MRWLPNISFSSTSPPSSSSSSSSTALFVRSSGGGGGETPRRRRSSRGNSVNDHDYRGGARRFGASKYTRQRKLPNLSDRDDADSSSSKWPDSETEPVALSRSPSSFDQAVPLPLPELSGIIRRNEMLLNLNYGSEGDRRRPSPKPGPSRGTEERDKRREKVGYRIGDDSNFPIRSVFDSRERPMKKDHAETRSPGKVQQNLHTHSERSRNNFRVDVPIRSAPTSPFSSPVLSPQRMSSADLLSYNSYTAPNKNKVWSAPEMPTMISGLPPPAFLDYSAFSSNSSPIQSPRGRSPHRGSPTGPASPLHSKPSIETPTARCETSGHVNVHPLPLPPGASLPSPSAPVVTTKPESLSMKNQWQKGKLIGRGTFGSVYVASNRETGALCAMKEVELFPDDPKSAECIKQLEQEIKVLSQLKHPNIVQYYGSEIVDDRFYIYLEYVHPGSINKYVREHCGAITESVVRNFTRHILSGLAYLHSTKTIHRDIKGANLLVDSSGVVKLADFGMAKHLTGQAADLSLKGSPYWMAPELMQAVMQRDSNSDLALAVDIWSLGCTIIEMLTGKPPFSEFEGAAAMFKVMRDSPPIPESLSSEGKDFLRCCFKRNPAERHSAVMLLEHRFVKNSQQLDVPSCAQTFCSMNLMDKFHSPKERSETKFDQFPKYPNAQLLNGKAASESETGQQSHQEIPDLTVASRYSPRSTLEGLPSLSPPHPVAQNMYPLSPANTYSTRVNHVSVKNHIPR